MKRIVYIFTKENQEAQLYRLAYEQLHADSEIDKLDTYYHERMELLDAGADDKGYTNISNLGMRSEKHGLVRYVLVEEAWVKNVTAEGTAVYISKESTIFND